MRVATGWQDYELIDAGDGERLERWGEYTLRRPDPAAIFPKGKNASVWNGAHAVYHRSDKGGGRWEYKRTLPEFWRIGYGELTFKVSPTGFKHTGVFPEQAVNWDFYRDIITQSGREISVLNLFGYTGGASIACLAAGAKVVHLDASKRIVAWAKENAQLSDLADKHCRYIIDDAQKFLQREARRGNSYDAIIMDPPSYGRGPSGEVWQLEKQLPHLLRDAVAVLSPKPLFLAINGYTAGIAPGVFAATISRCLDREGATITAGEIGLPIADCDTVLPCGGTAIAQWRNGCSSK